MSINKDKLKSLVEYDLRILLAYVKRVKKVFMLQEIKKWYCNYYETTYYNEGYSDILYTFIFKNLVIIYCLSDRKYHCVF